MNSPLHGGFEKARSIRRLRERLFDTMMDAYAAVDMAGTIIDFNNAFLKLLGYSSAEVEGLSYRDITPEKWHSFESHILTHQVKTRGFSDLYEKEYRKKDGTVFPVELRAFLIKDEQGHDSAMWAIIRDITTRKQTEAKLRESKARFRTIVETTAEWIWEFDTDGVRTYSNPAIETILGYRGDEIVGRPAFALVHADDTAEVATRLRQCVAEKRGWREWILRWRHKDGTYRILESNAEPILDATDQICGFRGSDRDITAQKQAQSELEETRNRYQTMVEWTPMAIAVHRAGRVIYVNPAAARLMGASSSQDMIGKPMLEFVHPDYRQIAIERAMKAIEENTPAPLVEEKFIRLDGLVIDVEVQATAIMYEGEPAVYVAASDITARKLAERRSRESMIWWKTLFEYSPLPTYVWEQIGGDWKLASCNDAAEYFSGEKIHETIGARASELYAQSPEILAAFSACKLSGLAKADNLAYAVSETGEVKNISVHCTFIPEKYVLLVIQDQTEIMKSHAALARSEAHLRLIADAIPGPVSHIGPDGRYSYFNHHYEAWFGDKGKEGIGRTPRELLSAELYARVEPYFERVLNGEQVTWETTVKTADGRHLVGQVTHIPDFDRSGNPHGIFTIVFDITTRKQAEDALRSSLREKEMLLAEVHHRVKNNLQVISSLIGMQTHLIQDTSALVHLESLKLRIRAMGLLHTLLYKSFELGSVPIKIYLATIAEQVFAVYGRNSKGVELITDIEEISLNIETSLPIGLIVNETISNALKYAFGAVEHPRIALNLKKMPDGFRLEVCDNGRGIDKNVDKRNSLGMRLVEVLSKQLRGNLDISSREGTRICLEFAEQHKEAKRWETEKS